jgi:probable phosphoglycerate mutase
VSGPVVAYIDGGARGNPGPAGYGVRIESADGTLIEELTGAIGTATNNVAEYRGLLAALTYLTQQGHRNVVIRSDSQLLTKQMAGQFKVRHPGLRPLHKQATELVATLDRVCFEHVPREQNKEADRLANLAMDGGTKQDGSEQLGTRGHRPAKTNAKTAAAAADGVIAIGVDIESISRVDRLLTRYGDRFVERVFTDGEAGYSLRRKHPAQHFAGRFAAKEAAMKALGTGRALGVLWRNVEVVRVTGPPQLQFHGAAAKRFEAIGARRALVTITHSSDLALAQVLLLGR